VTLVEKFVFPRDKPCGDALTPRAVLQLQQMGLASYVDQLHRVDGVDLHGPNAHHRLQWPDHDDYPRFGAVVRRGDLDGVVAGRAEAAGVRLLAGHEAIQPILDRGFVRGATVQRPNGESMEIRATYTVVADGANSRFGRSLGTFRTREWPFGSALRGYWYSPAGEDTHIRADLGLTDRNGHVVPGYGWTIPMGDGTVNVGVGVLSSFREFKGLNPSALLDDFVQRRADEIGLDPEAVIGRIDGGRVPLGHSVGPTAGPSYLVIGDASGSASPFNGDGIASAYETGRLAASVLHEALTDRNPAALQRYPQAVAEMYGRYFQVGRLFARLVGHPAVMRELSRTGMRSRALSEAMLRVQSNLLRPNAWGLGEVGYRVGSIAAKFAPNA
jgi:geranylgeranyl reductase family protein